MRRTELVAGPKDGEFIDLDGTPTMEMMLWIPGTDSVYGWDGYGEFDKLYYMGERKHT